MDSGAGASRVMTTLIHNIETDFGVIKLNVLFCDVCSRPAHVSQLGNSEQGWLKIDNVGGGWGDIHKDFCSMVCLKKYITLFPDTVDFDFMFNKFSGNLDKLREQEQSGTYLLYRGVNGRTEVKKG